MPLSVPNGDRSSQHEVIVNVFAPGAIAVVCRPWINRHLEVQQFLHQGLRFGQRLGHSEPLALQKNLKHAHQISFGYPVLPAVPAHVIAAMNRNRYRVEPSLRGAASGSQVQFERLGYFCVDTDSSDAKLVFNRTVTLRDSWAKLQRKG